MEKINNYIAEHNKLLQSILTSKNQTYKNTLELLNEFDIKNHYEVNYILMQNYINEDEEIRKESYAAQQAIEKLNLETDSNPELYELTKNIYENEKKTLEGEDLLFVEEKIRTFKQNGLDLNPEHKTRVFSLKDELSTLCAEFNKNISERDTTLKFSADELEGMPRGLLNSLERDGDMFIVNMSYPHVTAVYTYVKSEKTKRIMYTTFNSGCSGNVGILFRILNIRHEIANLLGYNSWADYRLENSMVKDVETVKSFLKSLVDDVSVQCRKEIEMLNRRKGSVCGPHEIRYYSELIRRSVYDINSEELREYFSMENVLAEMFLLYEAFFNIKFKGNANIIEVYDKNSTKIGEVHLDLFPRKGKFTHNANFAVKNSTFKDPESINYLVCNLREPRGDIPSLLSHGEVITLFHEFGHSLHNIFGKTKILQLSGTQVKWDFVEAPSQMLESFCWNADVLGRMGKHYKTGKPLSKAQIDRLIKSRPFGQGIMTSKQLALALADLELHSRQIKTPEEIHEIYYELTERLTNIKEWPNTIKLATFSHIVSEYDSKYYGYLWSKIIAEDIFRVIKEDPSKVVDYRKKILECGGTRDPQEMLKDFLGREVSKEAFLETISLRN